jgi:hypothetical protein
MSIGPNLYFVFCVSGVRSEGRFWKVGDVHTDGLSIFAPSVVRVSALWRPRPARRR